MTDPDFKNEIEQIISRELGLKGKTISRIQALSGGSINRSSMIEFGKEKIFLKYNFKDKYPAMFEKERRGLELLRNSACINIPKVLYCGSFKSFSFLMLEYIESEGAAEMDYRSLAKGLACIHKNLNSQHGLDHDNYIGSLVQKNQFFDDGVNFFMDMRLKPMFRIARDRSLISDNDCRAFDKIGEVLEKLIPAGESACLLHGDLWSGNVIANTSGEPVFIDPAVYYSYREIDLSMTKLFGGFPDHFYNCYNREYPLEQGWKERMEIFNLYPLLVHVNLFGTSYMQSVRATLRRYTNFR